MPLLFGAITASNQQARADKGVMFPIAMASVGAAGASYIEFTSIPNTYKHLQVRQITYGTQSDNCAGQFNSDTGNNYARHFLYGDGSGAYAGDGIGINYVNFGYVAGANSYGANRFSAAVTDILDYSSTTKYKTTRCLSGQDNNGSGLMVLYSGLWMNTAAISNIKLFPGSGSFSQNTQFALYGIKG
jgi:hypothetical protein